MAIKGPYPSGRGHKNISPFYLVNFSSSLFTPIVTQFIFNTKNIARKAITL
jgi:hypothetical protein